VTSVGSGVTSFTLTRPDGAEYVVTNASEPFYIEIPHADVEQTLAQLRLTYPNATAVNSALFVCVVCAVLIRAVVTCSFFNQSSQSWSDDGCWVAERHANYTLCACTHLTDFSIRMPPDNFALFVIPIVIDASNFATLAFLCALAVFYVFWMVAVTRGSCPGAYHRFLHWLSHTRPFKVTPRDRSTQKFVRRAVMLSPLLVCVYVCVCADGPRLVADDPRVVHRPDA
jgi:hypothetical protein